MADIEYVVQMKGITKVYPNGIAANQGVDFDVKKRGNTCFNGRKRSR